MFNQNKTEQNNSFLKAVCPNISTPLSNNYDFSRNWAGENGCANYLVFEKLFNRKVLKSRDCVINNYADTQIFLLATDV